MPAHTVGTPAVASLVQQRVAALAARRGAAGAQYVVYRHGRLWLECCHGTADVLQARPVTPLTTFNIYSVTKSVTAAALLALASTDRLDLDAPVGVAAGVEGLGAYGTVRETLLHRAGFRNPNPMRWIHPAQEHHRFDEAAFVQAQVAALQGTRRRWARSGYSNPGYLLLGRAIERAWGGPFVQAVQALVLDRLDPGADRHLGFVLGNPDGHAHGHLRRHGVLDWALGLLVDRAAVVQAATGPWVQLGLHQVNGSAYGGLLANARGMAGFALAALGQQGGLAPAVREALNDVVPGPGPQRSLGWFAGALGPHRWLAHAGGGLGAYAELRLYPALGAASALLTNGPGFTDARCLDAIDPTWLDADPAGP